MSTDPRFAPPTPFARLVYAHAVSTCGDACLTVSLAGSLFFQSPTHAAREKVLLYLVLTMAPFAVVAPIVGPALDRRRGARRLVVAGASAGRAILCLAMAQYISKAAPAGLVIYPLAFGVLVLAKAHSIARSSLVPALVNDDDELVQANSRLALVSVIAAIVGGIPAAGVQALFGADWSLRLASVVFIVAAVLATKIPASDVHHDPQSEVLEREEMHEPSILLAGSAMGVLRGSVGFLAFFAAFSLKHDLFALGAVVSASAAGGFVGVLAAPILRRLVREEVILASALVVPATFALLGAAAGGGFGFVLAGMALAIGASAGRLGFDSLLQRDGPDAIRGRAFARFETRFQLLWVIGGLLGVIPFGSRFGLFSLALLLGFAAVSYAAALRAARRRVIRTKLMPEAVDRAITRSRARAADRLWRTRRARPTGSEAAADGEPPDALGSSSAPELAPPPAPARPDPPPEAVPGT
jgi:hypothetical protein